MQNKIIQLLIGLAVVGSARAAGRGPVEVENFLLNRDSLTISSDGADSTFLRYAKFYTVDIPQDAKAPFIRASGGTGDIGLIMFVNLSGKPDPSLSQLSHVCISSQKGNNENCKPNSVATAQKYYVMVYSADGRPYSNVQLRAIWD